MHYIVYESKPSLVMCTVTLQLDPSVDTRDAVPEVGPGAALALAQRTGREARVLDHFGKLGLRRELANALDQILVRGAVPGEDRAKERDDGERVLVVDAVRSHGASAKSVRKGAGESSV